MTEFTTYATTSGQLPRVRLSDDRQLAMCFDPECDSIFARRVGAPTGLPEEGMLIFQPGWVCQGEIWRSRTPEQELIDQGLDEEDLTDRDEMIDKVLEATSRMHKRRKPDFRVVMIRSALPTHVICPTCRHMQIAEPDLLLATEARASVEWA